MKIDSTYIPFLSQALLESCPYASILSAFIVPRRSSIKAQSHFSTGLSFTFAPSQLLSRRVIEHCTSLRLRGHKLACVNGRSGSDWRSL
ncbi:hypothetical protein CPB83DRAFT_852531 [Crepidotus variabilis]|uniref:Uncharacterized protein n=1 Tax=Crepidotus variabilis TaxID=179855 RepID=A0A9P6EHW0_9AGAR|nr:hypothetical protein CPB83DRAFT_852531 [Crepidotus variabilis]